MSAPPQHRAKAQKAIRTSDVTRPRTLVLATLGAAAGVGAVLAASGTPMASERPIVRVHAKVACTSCHAEPAPAPSAGLDVASAPEAPAPYLAASCKQCHGTSHGSTRGAHRKLVASGELTCATCHTQHAGAQGVTFQADGTMVRWGSGAEVALETPPRQSGVAQGAIPPKTTVPLVPISVCAKCHDPTRAADPISACVPANARSIGGDLDAGAGANAFKKITSQCFDEHTKLGELRAAGAAANVDGGAPVCVKQHDANRFVAWEAAREVASTTSWVATPKHEGVPWMPAAGALVGALALGAASTAVDKRKRRATNESAKKAPPAVPAARKRLPMIDESTCLGCYACVDACPFDVLTIDKYVAVVARPEECCGVLLCEQVCPNGSLRVHDGEPILDRPATTGDLESRDVPGLFLAGDLTGLPLIKNAINQGVRVIDRVAQTLPRRGAEPIGVLGGSSHRTDVLVIGAGPAGLSAALRAKERGISCVVVEQATVAASIKSFPRDKIVHDPPLDLPIEGELWLQQATKEELLAQWTRIVRARQLDVREGHRVVDIGKDGDAFVVIAETSDGQQRVELRASRVVLAIGRRGTPRRLELEMERGTDERVSYALADARSFEGKRVVVVGLGDSAMEAAIALARQPNTTVTISYRGARFARGKAKNVAQLEALIAQKKLKVLFETIPVAVTKTGVTLESTGPHKNRRSVAADAMLVLIGGVPAWDLLTRAGIVRPDRASP